jgi:arsenate reductase (thioredoxin)
MKRRVLFVCIHNSARSQMAMTYLNLFAPDQYEAESAGLEKGNLNQNVVKVLLEEGIDISKNETNSAFDFYRQGRSYDFVITVCDKKAAEECPIFPGEAVRLHWSFDDPSKMTGTEEEVLAQIRVVRDQIKTAIQQFIQDYK